MNKVFALSCAVAGFVGLSVSGASARDVAPSSLPSIVHIDETVVVYHRHHHHHARWVTRHGVRKAVYFY